MHLPLYNTHKDNYNMTMSYSGHFHLEAPLWVCKHLKAVAATMNSGAHRIRCRTGEKHFNTNKEIKFCSASSAA